jgi:hypothetical protein
MIGPKSAAFPYFVCEDRLSSKARQSSPVPGMNSPGIQIFDQSTFFGPERRRETIFTLILPV